jgi:hypothetical protein
LRGRVLLVAASTVTVLVGMQLRPVTAGAHVLYSNICVWHDGVHSLKDYAETSDGRDYDGDGHGDGYTKSKATAKSDQGSSGGFHCPRWSVVVPAYALAIDTWVEYYNRADRTWYWCSPMIMDWKYNQFQDDQVTQAVYWRANCGSTWYISWAGAFRLIGSTWYGGWIIADRDTSHWWS